MMIMMIMIMFMITIIIINYPPPLSPLATPSWSCFLIPSLSPSNSKPQSAAIWLPEPLRSKQKLGMAEDIMATMLDMATMNITMLNMLRLLQ